METKIVFVFCCILVTNIHTFPAPESSVNAVGNKYYTMETYVSNNSNIYYEELQNMTTLKTLEGTKRIAVTVNISTPFRFFGNEINRTIIASGGFMYMGLFSHQYLTATQYIAPLMANFVTKPDNNSNISYKELSDRFIVEWKNVYLVDQNSSLSFTFQAILHSNGTIVFAYKKIPIPVKDIMTANHPVKVGLSDGFYMDKIYSGQTRRVIYEYSKISVNEALIKDNVAILVHPKKTCNLAKTCTDCTSQNETLECSWCDNIQRCSDGLDWYRQQWLESGCPSSSVNTTEQCHVSTTTLPLTRATINTTTTKPTTTSENPSKAPKSLIDLLKWIWKHIFELLKRHHSTQ